MNSRNKAWQQKIRGRLPVNNKKEITEETQEVETKPVVNSKKDIEKKVSQSVDTKNSSNKEQQNVEAKPKTGSKRRRKRGKKLPQSIDNKNTESQQTGEYSYIQKSYKKNNRNEPTVLNQFICLECYNVNLVEELNSRETKLFSDKDVTCSCCKKKTTQICVKDKELKKAQIEMTSYKTEEEARAYQIMTTRRKQAEDTSDRNYQKGKLRTSMYGRGKK